MKKLLVLGFAIFLSSGCVSQPDPWTPDSHVDGKAEVGQKRADGTGDVRPGDMALPDAVEVVIPKTDVVDAAVADTADAVAVLDLLDAIDVVEEIECVPQCVEVECGDDGCGGNCGDCGQYLVCAAGTCHPNFCKDGLKDFGCCAGNVWLWCDDDGGLKGYNCGDNDAPLDTCGWDSGKYECGGNGEDPEGNFPLECCESDCTNKDCGSDGCWGDCGTGICQGEQEICVDGLCKCQPECEGVECGNDGCDDVCGECNEQSECVDGVCVCKPNCAGKDCGDDGCDGDCGTCPGDQDVCGEGLCVCQPDCTDLDCGDGGCAGLPNVCGKCEGQDQCVEGLCVCQSLCDGLNCGDGGCPLDAGACGTCPGPLDLCVAGQCECKPECEGKECGADGCDGSCGDCNGPQDMCLEGACICQPDCNDKECGEDGCNGECDICPGGQDTCIESTCVCQPDCDEKTCGADGCGGNCGECDDGNPCSGIETCLLGACLVGNPVDCSGAPQCIKKECNPSTGLCDLPTIVGGQCDDGDACTLNDACGSGVCQSGDDLNCDDAIECTSDSCDVFSGCVFVPANGMSCDGGEGECVGGECVPLVPTCNDVACPELDGYEATCNSRDHCEYSRIEETEDWHHWDVWVYVPPGNLTMGSDGEGGESDELPVHSVNLSYGYLVAKYEVVVQQYEACESAQPETCTPPSVADWAAAWGVNTSDKDRYDHPQNGLTWYQARDFCAWGSPGGRLPTEAEWEFAATGSSHTKYPWGDSPGPSCMNNTAVFNQTGQAGGYGCGAGGTWPVGSKSAGMSATGTMDMSGNLLEWCEDWYHEDYVGAPLDGSAKAALSTQRVARGGTFASTESAIRTAKRSSSTPGEEYAHFGARCVRPAPAAVCGGIACPVLDGYFTYCNRKDHCEYVNLDTTGWKKWDVWIYVPSGSFEMGSPEEEEGHQTNEWPVHKVIFPDGFMMAKFEVVVAQYQACNAEVPGQCSDPSTADWSGNGWGTNYWDDGADPVDPANVYHLRPGHPQNGLTWQQAKDYCGWAAPGGRLPSEAEWEFAATGFEHRKYPWGDGPEPSCIGGAAVFNDTGEDGGYGCGVGGTWPVGSKNSGMSFCGALDMAGNAWEWCEDYYHGNYGNAPADGSAWVAPEDTHRVVRGGRFADVGDNMRTARRDSDTPQNRRASNGVRCVRPVLCTPDCEGKQCGDDGCGGNCGICDAGTSCDAGQCVVKCGDGQCGEGEEQCNCAQDCTGGCSGCCSVLECKTGDTLEYCGSVGETCDECNGGKVCEGGDCVCTPEHHQACSGGKLYWYNSCDVQGSLVNDCHDGNVCTTDGCTGSECTNSNVGNGAPCGAEKSCQVGVCQYHCGDGVCASTPPGTETCCTCTDDCGSCCGNGQCDCGETGQTCPVDCDVVVTEGFVAIEAGDLWMGSPDGDCPEGYPVESCIAEPGRYANETLHFVTLTHDFEMQVHEVSQGEWKAAFSNWNPSYFGPNGAGDTCGDNCPVEQVSWYDSLAYANWKSDQEDYAPCYVFSTVKCEDGSSVGSDYSSCLTDAKGGIDTAKVMLADGASTPYDCQGYRLPMEAEWEYSARAGSLTALHPSEGNDGSLALTTCGLDPNLDQIGWYCGNTSGSTKPVGGKEGNGLGLHDMSGNVNEWCWDKFCVDNTGYGNDPDASSCIKTYRVRRGGGRSSNAKYCRSAYRDNDYPDQRVAYLGFRLSRTLGN